MIFLQSIQPIIVMWIQTIPKHTWHLFTVNEMLGKQIATLHNLSFYLWLVREARKHILVGDFNLWKNQMCRQMDNRL